MKLHLIMFALFLSFAACKQETAPQTNNPAALAATALRSDPPVLQQYCYACHNPAAASHDAIIAPPLAAVRMRYLTRYRSEDSFMSAMTTFLANPSEDNAVMFGAIKRFGLMPRMSIDSAAIREIVTFLYNNQPREPDWLDEQMRQEGMR